MVRHDYACQQGHVFEATVSWDTETLPCCAPGCPETATRAWLPRHASPGFVTPIVVHRNPKTGKYSFPGRADAATPEGYERVELRTVSEVRHLEREVNADEMRKHEIHRIREELTFEPGRRERRAQLFQQMANMSNQGRDFARFAIDQHNRKRQPKYEPGFHVEVLS